MEILISKKFEALWRGFESDLCSDGGKLQLIGHSCRCVLLKKYTSACGCCESTPDEWRIVQL